jgi:hypothetical protein
MFYPLYGWWLGLGIMGLGFFVSFMTVCELKRKVWEILFGFFVFFFSMILGESV